MALTAEAVNTYVASIQGVRRLLTRNTDALWRQLPKGDATQTTAALLDVFAEFIAAHGELAALAAADFYDEVRDASDYLAELAPPAPPDQVNPSARWAVTPIFSESPDEVAALGRIQSVADRLVVNQGHDTVFRSGSRDPRDPLYARVPVGKTCAWCRLLASRGAVYRSQATAMRSSHDKCDCKLTPVFGGDSLPYDPEPYRDEYLAARRSTDSASSTQVLAEMRDASGTH